MIFEEERGSAPVDFVLVGLLLTALTLAVLQLGFVAYTHNVVRDAAIAGAHHAALADTSLADGEARTRDLIVSAFGDGAVTSVRGHETLHDGIPSVTIDVAARLPIIGTMGVPEALAVTAHAPAQ